MDWVGWLHLCLGASSIAFAEDRAFANLHSPEDCHGSRLRRGDCPCTLCRLYRRWWWATMAVAVQGIFEGYAAATRQA